MYVRIVELVSQKKKLKTKNVQVAEAKTQESETSPQPVLEEQPQTEETTAPPMPFDLSTIDPEKIKMAEELGIPVGQIISWAASVEQRFAAIQQNLEDAPQKVVAALKAEALKGQQAAAQRMQQGGSPQGGGQSGAIPMLLQLLSSGGGSNPMQDKMMSLMFERTIAGMDLSNALTKAMIIKLAPDLAGELTRELVKKG